MACSFSPGYIRRYVDGKFINTTTTTITAIAPTFTSLRIGGSNTGGELFDGMIDNVAIYMEALSTPEIRRHYVEGLKKYLTRGVP